MGKDGGLTSLDNDYNDIAHVKYRCRVAEFMPRKSTRIRVIEIHDDSCKHAHATVVYIILLK